jgi:hypothetical protein
LTFFVCSHRWVQIILTYSMLSTKLYQPQPNFRGPENAVLTPFEKRGLLMSFYEPAGIILIYGGSILKWSNV